LIRIRIQPGSGCSEAMWSPSRDSRKPQSYMRYAHS
jgi:hypothetical protein